MKFTAVIFDLDGTLIDSEPIFRLVAKRAAKDFGHTFSDELFLDLVGLPGYEVEQGIRAAFGDDFPMAAFRDRFVVHWADHVESHGIDVKPGVRTFVSHLDTHTIPYAIATSTAYERARQSLALAGLANHFPTLIGGDQVTNGKPAPDIYLEAAAQLAVPAVSCIAIEDSKVGVAAARAAGMYTIMIPDLKQPDAETAAQADLVLPSLSEALALVAPLL